MATQSYLSEAAGAVVVAGAFADDDAARAAIDTLHGSGVRPQDISVLARDRQRAEQAAGEAAWTPWRNGGRGPLGPLSRVLSRPGDAVPKSIRERYGAALRDGKIVVVIVAGGQPPDTLVALLTQAGADAIGSWWTDPLPIFAPPELAGPF